MPKGQQRGNKEAKKPKKDRSLAKPATPATGVLRPPAPPVVAGRNKKA